MATVKDNPYLYTLVTSIATVMEKLEKQILRSKDRLISRKRHGGTRETLEPEA